MAKVLVVDDSLYIRNHVSKLLAEQGHETVTAEDGEQAISIYKAALPDLVLLDVIMPKQDGLDTLKEIREFDPQARVVMLTSIGHPGVTARAIKFGAKDFMMKPVSPDKLIATLKKVLK